MMKILSTSGNAMRTPGVLLALMRNVNRQKKFIQETLGSSLHTALEQNDGSLDKDDLKKITHYYGLAVPAILGEALCTLRGKGMSLRERLALTYQGAMTGLFDDFFDKEKMNDESVKAFMERPAELTGQNTRQRLFLEFYKKALEYAEQPEHMLYYLRKVYGAQIASKGQAIPGSLSLEEIKRITVEKGGVSVLFYRSVLSNPLSKEEEDALYRVGGLMQFGNDIFDVYKDCLHHIDTLITVTKKVDEVRVAFREMMSDSFASFLNTNYPPKNIRKFLRLVSMSLCGRCFVCLDQLESKERGSDNVFTPYQYSRQDLVCDLDKGSNKWKSVVYFIRS